MGLGYLAGSLLAYGYETDIWDADVELDRESFEHRLARDPWPVVGISAPTPLIVNAWQAAATARRHGAVSILGGPHLTLMPDESMARPEVDLVVRGEAEFSILEVMQGLGRDPGRVADTETLSPRLFNPEAGWGHVAGLSWRDLDGVVHHNPPRSLFADLDALPFPAHQLFHIERYTNLNPLTDGLDPRARAYTIVTSRGCPYKCIYCSKPITGHTWRPRSVPNVIAEWRWLVEDLHATEIGVTDDVWNLDRDRAKELCRALIANGLNHVPWVTIHGMKVNNTDLELFRLMKEAGCLRVGFGVESGDDQVLRHIIKKGQTVDMARDAFRWAKQAGLQTMGFFIYGMPGETEETLEATTRLALELDPDLAHFLLATPYPGTELWTILEQAGSLPPSAHDWSRLAIQNDRALFATGDLDVETIERKWHEAHRRFYLRPARVARIALRRDTWLRLPYYAKQAAAMLLGLGERQAELHPAPEP